MREGGLKAGAEAYMSMPFDPGVPPPEIFLREYVCAEMSCKVHQALFIAEESLESNLVRG